MSGRARPWAAALAVAALAAVVLVAACGPARRSEPLAGPTPLASDAERRGRLSYMRHCQPCHPGGEAGLGPALNDKPLPGALVKLQVRRGLGAMPSFSEEELDDAALDEVVAYLEALRRK